MIIKLLLLLLIFQFACDKQSNPFIGDDPILYLENMSGESRDLLVLNNLIVDVFDCSILEPQDCEDDIWCKVDGNNCIHDSNDLLIVGNEYDEGLIVFDINQSDNGLSLNKIYYNNNFEEIDATVDNEDNWELSENDLELRQLAYDSNSKMLYILDKFEYIYNIWLPVILDQSRPLPEFDNCYDLDFNIYDFDFDPDDPSEDAEGIILYQQEPDGTWDPKKINTFSEGEKLHSTQLILDDFSCSSNESDCYFDLIYLLKYNTNISSESSIPDPSLTSCSRMGTYEFNFLLDPNISDPNISKEAAQYACDAVFNSYSQPSIGPLFDYSVTDIFKSENFIIVANSYDEYVFKDNRGNNLNINYYNGDFYDGCALPNNSISLTNDGKLLYNISSSVSYFEFNLIGTDLSNKYPENLFYDNNAFGDGSLLEDYSFFSVSISSNKIIGYAATPDPISPGCGTLIDLELNQNNNLDIVSSNTYPISIFNFDSSSGVLDYYSDIKVNSKVRTVYSNNSYLIAGLEDDGCYISLLGEDSLSMTKFGCSNFSVNDIIYDEENSKLLFICGNDGVLIYHWAGSGQPSFQNHIVSSHAYKARIYVDDENNQYVIVATKYGVEIYSL